MGAEPKGMPMTWTKTGDEFADECWTLSDAAYRLHHEGLTWSNRKATEGQLAKDDMRRWAHHPEAADELVNVGWWEDHSQHFQIIHHLGYQRTREEVAHQSNANRKNAEKRWAAAKKKKAAAAAANEPQCESHSEPQCEQARTGQARTGSTWGPEESEYAPGERERLESRADRNAWESYDR